MRHIYGDNMAIFFNLHFFYFLFELIFRQITWNRSLLIKIFITHDTASCARVYQHDVRAKQTKVCDAERAGFHTPTHASDYIETDGQLKLAAVFPPVDNLYLLEDYIVCGSEYF